MMAKPRATLAFIRGINLGPAKKVSMPALREALEQAGFEGARTHLNSGNVIVVSTQPAASVGKAVHDALAEKLGVAADVIVRTADELAAAIDADPLSEVATDGSKHFLGLLNGKAKQGPPVDVGDTEDRAAIVGNHLYLWCPNGLSKSVYWKVNWDKQLSTSVTMRNWNTVTRVLEMARANLR
jgi:uncharacterized protein (DUF1697 family)